MATVSRYQTASGATRYRVRYRTPDNRQTDKRGFLTKRDADRYANGIEVAKMRGEYVMPSMGRITVGELVTDWLARKKQATAPSHYRTLESAWRVHVGPRWAAVSVAEIDVLGIEAWITGMVAAGGGATTVHRAYGVFSGLLTDAVKANRLAVNPARAVANLPRKTARRHVYLTADEVHRLAEESAEHRALVLTLAFCGTRWGETIALRVRDIEFLRKRLNVSENAVQLGVEHALGQTKGREARSVPVPVFVLNEVSKQCEGKAPDDLVFPGRDGSYLPRPKSSGEWFAEAVKRAEVQKVTPHDLRHTAASLAVSSGANVLALARMLGHKDPSITLRVYADLFDTDLDAVAVSLHNAYSPDNVGKMWARTAEGERE